MTRPAFSSTLWFASIASVSALAARHCCGLWRRLSMAPDPRFIQPRIRRAALSLALAAGLVVTGVQAQAAPGHMGRAQSTRAELQELLRTLEQTAGTESYSAAFRERSRADAEAVRRRLDEGDFQVGDQIELIIEGEQGMPLTLTVEPDRSVHIPQLGKLSLAGVLRAELNDKARAHVQQYIHNPVVRTRSMIRLAVSGPVARPGYHWVSSDALLSDVLTEAGGPLEAADVAQARIERANARILESTPEEPLLDSRRTIDQLNLRSGDQLVIPQSSRNRSGALLRTLIAAPAFVFSLIALLRMN